MVVGDADDYGTASAHCRDRPIWSFRDRGSVPCRQPSEGARGYNANLQNDRKARRADAICVRNKKGNADMKADFRDAWMEFRAKGKQFKIAVGMMVIFVIAVFAICADHSEVIPIG